MKHIEFLEMIKIMVDTGEIDLGNDERTEWLENIREIKKTIMDYWKDYIIKEIQYKDCCHPSDCNYDNWFQFFGDTDSYDLEGYMRELFTEEECEKLWQDSHK